MFGLFLALLYAGYHYVGGTNLFTIYQLSTSFLYTWYIWTTVVLGIIYGIIALLFLLGGAGLGAEKGGMIGGILGFIGGGVLSVLMLLLVGVSRACLIIGTILLKQALIFGEVPTWDTTKLIFGAVLLLIGIIMGRSSSSSKSK